MKLISPVPLLREGLRIARRAGALPVVTMLGFHLVILVVATPLFGWLFKEALRANGMLALDLTAIAFTGGIGISLTLILVILLVAFWLASAQFTVLVVMLRRVRDTEPLSLGAIAREVSGIFRKLLRPSALPLFFYLFFILPLSGFGFVSALSHGIAVPSFISGELLKGPVTAIVWIGFIALLVVLNLRFALSLPVFVLTDASGAKSMSRSWRLTRGWASVRIALAILVVLFAASIVTLVLVIAAIVPTALSDELWPSASAGVAAFSLGAAHLLSMVLTALVLTVIVSMLTSAASPATEPGAEPDTGQALPVRLKKKSALSLIAAGALVALGFGALHLGTMTQLSQHPTTLVLGHRGFSVGGAENTISGLEAAAAVGADLVEIDVMQTADQRFVVMHDADLSRLTGQNLQVKDLTLAELTEMTVRDQYGHEDKIPSLEQYISRAAELEMTLLIEIKLGGLDTPDHVDLLVSELEALNALDDHLFHTLDHASAERLKRLRPDSSVGYILAVAGVGMPETSADFIVIEQWTATQEMQDAARAAGLGFFAWTVNEEAHIRELLRRDIDGIITDHPDLALEAREDMDSEDGLAGTLIDALTQFVVVF